MVWDVGERRTAFFPSLYDIAFYSFMLHSFTSFFSSSSTVYLMMYRYAKKKANAFPGYGLRVPNLDSKLFYLYRIREMEPRPYGLYILAWCIVLMEICFRYYACEAQYSKSVHASFERKRYYWQPIPHYIAAYLLCLLAVFLPIRGSAFNRNSFVRRSISFLVAIDGPTALIIGLAHYFQSRLLLCVST